MGGISLALSQKAIEVMSNICAYISSGQTSTPGVQVPNSPHWYPEGMRITLDISESDIKEICRITGERKKGSAIRKFVVDSLMLKRRARLAQKFIDGEWGVEVKGFEATQDDD